VTITLFRKRFGAKLRGKSQAEMRRAEMTRSSVDRESHRQPLAAFPSLKAFVELDDHCSFGYYLSPLRGFGFNFGHSSVGLRHTATCCRCCAAKKGETECRKRSDHTAQRSVHRKLGH